MFTIFFPDFLNLHFFFQFLVKSFCLNVIVFLIFQDLGFHFQIFLSDLNESAKFVMFLSFLKALIMFKNIIPSPRELLQSFDILQKPFPGWCTFSFATKERKNLITLLSTTRCVWSPKNAANFDVLWSILVHDNENLCKPFESRSVIH